MRRAIKFIIFFTSLQFAVPCFAESSYGYMAKQGQLVDNVDHAGMMSIEGSQVSHQLKLQGFLAARKSSFNQVDIQGDADFDGVIIHGPAIIHGRLTCDDSHFNNDLQVKGQIMAEDCVFNKETTLYSNHPEFEECELNTLIVEKSDQSVSPKLYLEETIVKGDVIFKQPGIIYMDKSSKILGKVVGAQVEIN